MVMTIHQDHGQACNTYTPR